MSMDILKRALLGDRLNNLNIIDSHCHMGPWYNFYFPKAEIEEMVEDADRVGLRRMCVAPHASVSLDYRLGNRQVAEAVEKFPGRVSGLLVLNPHKAGEMDMEFEKYYKGGQFTGVKIHPVMHDYCLTGANYYKVYDRVKEYGGYVLAHTWEGDPRCRIDLCEIIIKDYPEIAFVLGHSGGISEGVEKSIKLVNRYENAYMDTSGFEVSDIWIEEIMDKADKSKVLFGSDMPFHDLRGGISRILFADLQDDVKEGILGRNYEEMVAKYRKKI